MQLPSWRGRPRPHLSCRILAPAMLQATLNHQVATSLCKSATAESLHRSTCPPNCWSGRSSCKQWTPVNEPRTRSLFYALRNAPQSSSNLLIDLVIYPDLLTCDPCYDESCAANAHKSNANHCHHNEFINSLIRPSSWWWSAPGATTRKILHN